MNKLEELYERKIVAELAGNDEEIARLTSLIDNLERAIKMKDVKINQKHTDNKRFIGYDYDTTQLPNGITLR